MLARKQDFFLFIFISIFAFFAFLMFHPFTMVAGDEGRFVQDALRISRGEIPIVDYGTRAPLLSWTIHLSARIGGRSIIMFRLPGILFSALSAGMIYLIGKELFSSYIGVIASLIFILSPYTLWNNVVIKTESLMILLIIISAYALIRALYDNKWYWYVFSGVCMGVAYIERQSAVAFMLATAFIVIHHVIRESRDDVLNAGQILLPITKKIVSRGSTIMAGVLIGFLPIFTFFVIQDTARAVASWLSWNAIRIGLSTKEIASETWGVFAYQFVRKWILTFTEGLAIQAGHLFVGLIFFLAIASFIVQKKTFNKKKDTLYAGILCISFGLFLYHAVSIVQGGTFRPIIFLSLSFFTSVFVGFLWLCMGKRYEVYQKTIQKSDSVIFLLYWVFALFITYSFYLPGYSREFIPALSIASAFVFSLVPWRSLSIIMTGVGTIVIMAIWITNVVWYSDPRIGGWWWKQQTINEVARYLEERTDSHEQIFAANPLPVMLASRRTVKDITSYAMVFVNDPNESWSTYPSPNRMMDELRSHPPRFVLVDQRMINHFYTPHDMFREFVEDNYVPAKMFGSGYRRDWTEVWELKIE